ncbi:unnamed protein product [Angiostrongylus costaricensis]|uniref:Mediator complex subunit 1 n=1 Tax=Angiostrongylus costaricensis TaxID=334426 RepID=A0A0R3PBH3_ANGCS|nr:unnamed protein product [Angiostrongylus costaricensis]
MVVANEFEDGFDLDKIDAEIKIEKIRQTASKLSWDGFQQALRRNLMEKRFVFDTEGRIDLLHAISTIRRNLPVDKNAELPVQLRQLSDSLECVLSSQQGVSTMKNADVVLEFAYDNDQATSDDAFEYVKKGDFGSLRAKIFAVIATIPSGLSAAEKSLCVAALDIFEAYLSASNDVKPSFENIGTFPLGFLLQRTALRPARIFYTVEPSYVVIKKAQLEPSDFDNLDYMELSVATVDREVELPAGDVSYGMWRRLERHLARPAAVKENVNLYRYMSGFKFQESELVMRTSFPEPYLQHRYIVSNSSLLEERDCVISEICIGNGSYLTEIVSIVRAQAMHNSLWESLLAMCSGKCKSEQPYLDVRIVPSPARYELSFCAANKVYLVRIELTREFEWIGTVEDANGAIVSADLNSLLTQRINRTRSIPVALVRVLKELGCETVHGRPVCEDQMSMEVDYEHGLVSSMDKVGNAWLPMFNRSKQPKKSCQPNLPEFTFEVHTVPLTTPGGLLASYKEIASERGAHPLTAARAEARTHLVQSDTALAISDLEAICQLADGMDDDSKTSTPSLPARHSTSPASSRPPGCVGSSGPGSGVPQLSPLETARLKMTSYREMKVDKINGPPDKAMGSEEKRTGIFQNLSLRENCFVHVFQAWFFELECSSTWRVFFVTPCALSFAWKFTHWNHVLQESQHVVFTLRCLTRSFKLNEIDDDTSISTNMDFDVSYTRRACISDYTEEVKSCARAFLVYSLQAIAISRGVERTSFSPHLLGFLRDGRDICDDTVSYAINRTLESDHSVGAAAAVGLASATPDVFEFADDRSVGSGSAYPSPSPQFTPFACGTAGSPLAGQSIRGATTKRRPRARKTANIGGRIGDFPSSIMKGPTMTGVSTRKPRGKTGVRRPRGSRKAALTITHAELEIHSRVPPPLQRSYSDYEQLSNQGLVGASTSPYLDTESDDECDPPPPPKSLGIFQSPATSHTLTSSSAANSPSHSMSPLYATSGTPVSTSHPPQSPLATASPSVNRPSTVPSPRSNQSKKPNVDAVVGRVKTTVPQQTTSAAKRSVFNDLYDDGTESSPPPEERTSLASTISSTANTSVSATPLQSTTITTQASTSSPRVSESVREQAASGDLLQSNTPTVNIEGANKLILKIPKVSSRASPSVETQKTKSIPMQTMPKLERQDKKREKERKEGHKDKSKDKSDETRRQKRKAEGKEKEREHKKHKTSNIPTQCDVSTPSTSSTTSSSVKTAPLPFGFVGSLKNFKIPKREDVKENGKEKEVLPPAPTRPVPPTPPTLPMPTPNPPLPLKSAIPKKIPVPIPQPPIIPMPRQPLLSTPPSVPPAGPPPLGGGPPRKPPGILDHRDRR